MNGTAQKLLLCLSVLTGLESAFGQEINVRILDARNGHGVSNEAVWVQFYEAPSSHVLRRIQLKTGVDGIAHIQLPAPQPTQLFLSLSGSLSCGGSAEAATEDILSRGELGGQGCKLSGSLPPPNPKPGEVVILMRRMAWWRLLLAPLERE